MPVVKFGSGTGRIPALSVIAQLKKWRTRSSPRRPIMSNFKPRENIVLLLQFPRISLLNYIATQPFYHAISRHQPAEEQWAAPIVFCGDAVSLAQPLALMDLTSVRLPSQTSTEPALLNLA